jgi:glycosyltransferase involved in cell wall biosynthesis
VDVSIVVPTFNEPALAQWLAALRAHAGDAEILVVDDSDALPDLPGATVIAGPRRGKGGAVREGLLAAHGDVIVILDADADEATMRRIPEIVAAVRDGHDVIIAERTRFRSDNLGRYILSMGLRLTQRVAIFHSARFRDTQCGFKAFRREAGRRLASLQTVDYGFFDIEYLYIAVRSGMRIGTLALAPWPESRPSHFHFFRFLRRDIPNLLRVKWNGLRGRYSR